MRVSIQGAHCSIVLTTLYLPLSLPDALLHSRVLQPQIREEADSEELLGLEMYRQYAQAPPTRYPPPRGSHRSCALWQCGFVTVAPGLAPLGLGLV